MTNMNGDVRMDGSDHSESIFCNKCERELKSGTEVYLHCDQDSCTAYLSLPQLERMHQAANCGETFIGPPISFTAWLNFNSYPIQRFLGWFSFGPDCAKKEIARAERHVLKAERGGS